MSNSKCECGEFEYHLPAPNPDSPVMVYGERRMGLTDDGRERWAVKVDICPDYDPAAVREKVSQYLAERGAAPNAVVEASFDGFAPRFHEQ